MEDIYTIRAASLCLQNYKHTKLYCFNTTIAATVTTITDTTIAATVTTITDTTIAATVNIIERINNSMEHIKLMLTLCSSLRF